MNPAPRSRREGFSIVEGIGCIVVSSIIMGALTYAMSGLFSQQASPAVTYGTNIYPQAPSFDSFGEAVDLHTAFSAAADQADSVIVIGGRRSHPALDPTGPSSALDMSFADTVLAASVDSDGFAAYSSWDQLQLNMGQLSGYLTSNPDPADFTILTVQGLSRVTSITQQRRHTAVINGRSLDLYEVTHQTIDWSTGLPQLVPNSDTGTTPTYSYRLFYAANEDVWSVSPGATHLWYRTDSSWDRDQEGPTRVIFADPEALSGQDVSAALAPTSRFVYFLPQLR